MSLHIVVIDGEGNEIELVGRIGDKDDVPFIKRVRELPIHCLKDVILGGSTIFNKKQTHQILKELEILRKSNINPDAIDVIEHAAKKITAKKAELVDLYIEFKG